MGKLDLGWSALRRLIADAEQHKRAFERAYQQVAKRQEALRQQIFDGGTTGDKIRDFITAKGPWSQEEENRYQAIQAELLGNKGQLVLVAGWRPPRERSRVVLEPDPNYKPGWEQAFTLGVLADGYLECFAGRDRDSKPFFKCVIPTQAANYFSAEECPETGPDINEYEPGLPGWFFADGFDVPEGFDPHKIRRVIAGDGKVFQWLRKNGQGSLEVAYYIAVDWCAKFGRAMPAAAEPEPVS